MCIRDRAEPLERERRFERAGHGDDGHVIVGDARFAQRAQRAGEETRADRRIEPRLDDGDAKGAASSLSYPVTSRSKPAMLGILRGFASRRMRTTLRSRRICAPMP